MKRVKRWAITYPIIPNHNNIVFMPFEAITADDEEERVGVYMGLTWSWRPPISGKWFQHLGIFREYTFTVREVWI